MVFRPMSGLRSSRIWPSAACAEAVAAACAVDQELGGLFRVARPDAAFEDRLVRTLRTRRQRQGPFLHPMLLRSAAAVAAAVAITGTGLVVNNVIEGNGRARWPLFGAETNPPCSPICCRWGPRLK